LKKKKKTVPVKQFFRRKDLLMYTPASISVPYVLDNKDDKRVLDLWSRLNSDRIVFVGDAISSPVANIIIGQLLYLESQSREDPIFMYINSPGGHISDGLAIYDVMRYVKPEVHTFCVGMAASMASVLLAAGEKGKRFILPNAEVMIHQPLIGGGLSGQATDIAIHAKHLERIKEKMTNILAEHTGQAYEKVLADCERDNYMTAEEALEYGLVDTILTSRKEEDDE